jgi:hypothetical protein
MRLFSLCSKDIRRDKDNKERIEKLKKMQTAVILSDLPVYVSLGGSSL